MAEPNLDDILGGGDSSAVPVVSTPASGVAVPANGSPAVWTLLGEAGDNATNQVPVASTVFNRMAAKGIKSPDAVVSDPGNGYEAWQNAATRAKLIKNYPVDSPAYQRAQLTLEDIQNNGVPDQFKGIDSYYSPDAMKALGHTNPDGSVRVPDWASKAEAAGQHGVNVGGNLFYSTGIGGTASASGEPDLDHVVATGPATPVPAAPKAPANPDVPTPQQVAGSDSGAAQWPIYDPTNNVGRNEDGSIAYIGKAVGYQAAHGKSAGVLVGNNVSDDPADITAWLKAHPQDTANHPQGPQVSATDPDAIDAPDQFDVASNAVGQGLANVRNSLEGADATIRSNPVGAVASALVNPIQALTGPSVAQERAELGQQVLNRNANEVNYGTTLPYQLGKFGGEVAGTLPIMAATGGFGELGQGALAGTRFGPAADFLAGDTAGALLGPRGASLAASGGLQGAQAAALTSAGSSAPLGSQVLHGAEGGAVAGLVPAVGGAALSKFGQKAALPSGVATLADSAVNKYGIPLSAPQILGAAGDRNAAVRWSNMFSEPGSGVGSNFADQKAAWTGRIGDTFGGDANGQTIESFSPDVLNGARKRIGDVFERVAKNTNITNTAPLDAELGSIDQEIQQTPLGDNGSSALQAQIANIRSAMKGGSLSGSDYQTLTRKGAPLDRAMNSADPNTRQIAGDIRSALDDALQSHAAPSDLSDLQSARAQYKNLMTVTRAVRSNDIEGQLTPGALNTAVNQTFKGRGLYGAQNSEGNLGELADIGRFFMREPPNSGTTPRLLDAVKRNAIPLGLEGGAGLMMLHDPEAALKLGAAGIGAAGLKYGGNLMYGLRNGAGSGARLLAPQANKFTLSPTVQGVLRGLNDNYVPVAALGANQFFSPQHPQ